jgi:HK97 gp10 family phage protein
MSKEVILGKMIRKHMLKVATNITLDAKVKAPVDTGALRDSIRLIKADGFNYLIGSDIYYAIYQELGTKVISAQPYLVPALRNIKNYKV